MLVIKIEMWPRGDESKKRLLEQAFIYNDGGAADAELGNYAVLLLKSPRFMKGKGMPRGPMEVNPDNLFKQGIAGAAPTQHGTCWRRPSMRAATTEGAEMTNGEVAVEETPIEELTMEQLRSERVEIIAEMNRIRSQLTTRKADMEVSALTSGRVNGYGSPRGDSTTYAAYVTWRAKATAALRHFETEAADLKLEIARRSQVKGPHALYLAAVAAEAWLAKKPATSNGDLILTQLREALALVRALQ